MAELLSQSEYARRKDVSRQYVNKLVQQGKIPTDDKKRIDPDIADSVLAQLADPARRLNGNAEDENAPAADDLKTVDAGEPQTGSHTSFAKFRSAREAYQAKLAQLDYEERAAKLVKKADVEREAFDVSRLLRDIFLSIPQEVAGTIVGMTDEKEISKFLRSKIRDALMEVSSNVSLSE